MIGQWKLEPIPKNKPTPKRSSASYFEKICDGMCRNGYTTPIWISLHFFISPTTPPYPFALLPPSYLNVFTYFSWGILCTYLIFAISSCMMTIVIIFVTYGFLMHNVLKNELFPQSRNGYTTHDQLRNKGNLFRAYRQFEILHKYANSTFEHVILPGQILVTQGCLSCNYVLLTSWTNLDVSSISILIMWTFLGITMWTVFLLTTSLVSTQGRRMLDSWKFLNWSKAEMKYMKKFKKGCRPLGVRVGGFYCVKQINVLKYLHGIFRGTFRALLALG